MPGAAGHRIDHSEQFSSGPSDRIPEGGDQAALRSAPARFHFRRSAWSAVSCACDIVARCAGGPRPGHRGPLRRVNFSWNRQNVPVCAGNTLPEPGHILLHLRGNGRVMLLCVGNEVKPYLARDRRQR